MDDDSFMGSEIFRNGEYTGRMPSPPRISVPPPTYLRNRAQVLSEHISVASVEYPFLHRYDWDESAVPCDTFSWKYESRRQAQKILPFLYLGPMAVSRDKDFLNGELITMVIAIRHARTMGAELKNHPSGALRGAADLGIVVDTVEIASNQALIAAFPHIVNIINNHLSQSVYKANTDTLQRPSLGKVLIVCESGNERSAAVVVALIMQVLQLGVVEALQIVNERRFCVNVDDTMRHVLRTYSDLLQAKRDVASASQSYTSVPSTDSGSVNSQEGFNVRSATLKRNLYIEDDEDMEDDDTLRFRGRAFIPFIDRNSQ